MRIEGMSNTEREASPSRDRESVTRNERDVTTPNGSDARCSELFVQFPRARMAGGGLKGTLAAMAREELEEQERDLRKGVPRNKHPGTRGGAMKSPKRRPPSVVSDDESVYGGGDAKTMRLRAAERNKARKEALKHKSRMVATQGLGAANPVFTDADPLWNHAWQVVNPRHRYVQSWDLMTLHLLVFTALVTPYEISFMDGLGGVNVEMLFWVNQLINIIFLVDMWLVFVTPFEGEDGIWVTSKQELALRYFKGMFIIDLLSIMPFDLIEVIGDGGSLGSLKVFRVLKLFRLLKMLRIFRGLKIVKKYEADYAIDYQALNISMLLVVLLVTAHWIACLTSLICLYDPDSPALEVFLPSMLELDEKVTTFKKYYYCFVWGLTWITTGMGEGHDSDAESSVLRAYIAMLLIVGAIANAAIIGGVMTIVDEMNEASREFYSNLNVLNVFLKREDVYNRVMKWRKDDVPGPEFCRRIRSFYLYKYANSKQYKDLNQILENVSDDMKRVLAEAMYGDILRSCGVFAAASADMIMHLSSAMNVNVYARGDTVYSTGEPATHLYFCVKGTVMLPPRAPGSALDVYRQGGEPFGQEVVYKFGQPRSRTAVCSVETVLLALDGEAIHYAIENFGGSSVRWNIMVSRNLTMVSACVRKAVKEVTRVLGQCDADAGVAYLEFSLGKAAVFQIDLSGRKENNLLHHLKRLTREALAGQGLRSMEVEHLLESFRKHEDYYDECTQREIIAAEKVEDLRHLLDTIEDDDGEGMDMYFDALCDEKIETIEAIRKLEVCDLKAIGVPLGHALLIHNGVRSSSSSIMDAFAGNRNGASGGGGNDGGGGRGRGNVRKDIRALAKSRSFGTQRQLNVAGLEELNPAARAREDEERDRRDERDNRDERDKSEARDERQMNRRLSENYSDDDDAVMMQPDCWTPTPSNVFGSGNQNPPRRGGGGRGGGARSSVSFSTQL